MFVLEDKAKIILEALKSYGERGCGIITLSLDTGISQESLRTFIKEYKKYCLPVEKNKFKLNTATKEQGCVEEIISTIEKEEAEQKVKSRVSSGFSYGFALGLAFPYIIDLSFYLYDWLF